MDEFKPNSNKYKKEQQAKNQAMPKQEKIVTNKVVTRKKSGFRKFIDEFIAEDAKNVKNFVFGEVLIPSIKKAVSDIIVNSVDMILYGESRGGRKRSVTDKVSYVNYTNYDRYSRPERDDRYRASSRFSYDDLIFATRGEAQSVLDRMFEILETYQIVRVADLTDLAGVSGSPVDNSYGWMSLRTAEIVRVRDGYIIKLPRAIPID